MTVSVKLISIGSLTITSYRSVRSQCDSSPFFTSIGEHVHSGGVALSRDLLSRWGGPVKYGDTLFVEGVGLVRVNDCMHERMKQHIDIWVKTLRNEQQFQKKWKCGKTNVYLLKVENDV